LLAQETDTKPERDTKQTKNGIAQTEQDQSKENEKVFLDVQITAVPPSI
jgi:hypothetical protein